MTVLAVLLAGATGATGTPPPEDAPSALTAGPPSAHQTVTLITGDKVTVLESGVAVEAGPDRRAMRFEQYWSDDRRYVIPSDAVDLVATGQVDLRLFDVAMLLAHGYGDADRDDLPLIVAHQPRAAATLQAAGETDRLTGIGLSAVRAAKDDIGDLWASVRGDAATVSTVSSGVTTVWLDGQRQLALEQSVHQVNAPAAWQAGFTGAGVTVAVLDSGIDPAHPDFAGRIREARNFTDSLDQHDTLGHGTHVASILAGSGDASGGRYRGVAPEAELLVGKVCPTESCPESAILAGMVWAAEAGASVVNLSLSGQDTPAVDPLEQAVNQLTEDHGTLFVASAGNLGPTVPVGSPASADAALAVGSIDQFNLLSFFSSRGPRVGDAAMKPDITAPGEFIIAARPANGGIGFPIDDHYSQASGTSMAAPHVSGAAALLAQQHPGWTGPQLKAALMASAVPSPFFNAFEQGAGRLDVGDAINQSVVTDPPSISFGLAPFPHDSDPIERVVTYHNLGTEPVDLDLSLEVSGPTGAPAPPGMFTLETTSVTLPAGEQAAVTVTADSRVDSPLGHFTGALVATGGGTTTRTPLGIDKEPERYQLTLTHLDRRGEITGDYITHVMGLDQNLDAAEFGGDGIMTLRLPPGRYHLYSVIRTPAGEQSDAAALAQPLVVLTDDLSLTLDARVAEPIQVTVPHPSARSAAAVVQYERHAPLGRPFGGTVISPEFGHTYTAHLGPEVPADEVISAVHSQWGEPGSDGDFMNSPYTYRLAWFERGRFWTGLDRQVQRRDLAAVPAEFRTPTPDRIGRHAAMSFAPEGSLGAGHFFPFHLPFAGVDYYTAEDVQWWREMDTVHPETGVVETVHSAPLVSFGSGWQGGPGDPTERWNQAVFGPAFPAAESDTQWVYRHAGALPTIAGAEIAQGSDAIAASVPLFTDVGSDHVGFSLEDWGRTALYRDGELIGETGNSRSGEFSVPDEPATYRLEVEGSRTSYAELSTHVSGVWTFESGHTPGAEAVVLPVMAIRFEPRLDDHNSALAGQAFQVPISIQRQAGTEPVEITSIGVEVSYDDGASWHPVTVRRAAGQWRAHLHHPAGAATVSLRASATASDDTSAEVTIVRGYRLRPPGID